MFFLGDSKGKKSGVDRGKPQDKKAPSAAKDKDKGGGKLSKEVLFSGIPKALEIMENLENHTKKSMHGKIMDFEENLNNHGKIMEFCEIN